MVKQLTDHEHEVGEKFEKQIVCDNLHNSDEDKYINRYLFNKMIIL
jgi:hypothetical protein